MAWTPLRTREKGMTDSIFTTFLRVEWGTKEGRGRGGRLFYQFLRANAREWFNGSDEIRRIKRGIEG